MTWRRGGLDEATVELLASVSDPTNVLALHGTLRPREDPAGALHCATSHLVVRAPPVPKLSNYSQHLRLFALSIASVESKERLHP